MDEQRKFNIQSLVKCFAEALAIALRHRQGVVVNLPKDENNLNEPYGTYLVWRDDSLVRVMPYNGRLNVGSIIFVDEAIANECKGSC